MASTVVLETEDAVIGDLACLVESPWSQAEAREGAKHSMASIGWCLDPAYGGRGYATEAAAELLRICFDEIGVRRVVAGAFADNVASVRVMEKIGMRIEARFREGSLHRDLGWLDGIEAAILAGEWRHRRR
jgi:RimJ/RimL family protein N-acetyltransferase